MKTKHTPAPWKVVNHTRKNSSEIIIRIETEKDSICEVHNLYRPESSLDGVVEKQANAQLIARAPELLKENEQLKEKLKAQEEHGQIIWKDRADIITERNKLQALNAELLEALKELLLQIGEHWDDEEEIETSIAAISRNKTVRAYKKAKAAIAQAEGKEAANV